MWNGLKLLITIFCIPEIFNCIHYSVCEHNDKFGYEIQYVLINSLTPFYIDFYYNQIWINKI